jgi:beta-galactosidase
MNSGRLLLLTIMLLLPVLINAQRIKQSINTSWQFHKGADTDVHGEYWERVNVPHTWNADDVMDDIPGYYRGVGWYQKEIYIPQGWAGKSIYHNLQKFL